MHTSWKRQERERVGVRIDVISDNGHLADVVVVWVQKLEGRASGKGEERDFLPGFNVGHCYSIVLHQVFYVRWIRGQVPG